MKKIALYLLIVSGVATLSVACSDEFLKVD